MPLAVVGCTHQTTSVSIREQLAFQDSCIKPALNHFRKEFPETETVFLSTCNRIEVYTAHPQENNLPSHQDVAQFLSEFHDVPLNSFNDDLFEHKGSDAVRHLFQVSGSLESMVVGEPQITSQVKQAYNWAQDHESVGPLLHLLFQRALRVAKRVHTETALAQRRVSIPSVAVADYAKQMFHRFDDKTVLVIGAGEMGQETLRYLIDEGVQDIMVINRSYTKAVAVAEAFHGKALPWSQLDEALATADLVIGTTGAREPIIVSSHFQDVMSARKNRLVFLLDLAVPRDFDPQISRLDNVYLYGLDELQEVCRNNSALRQAEVEKAMRIVRGETDVFMQELNHQATSPVIQRLRQQVQEQAQVETDKLFRELPDLNDHQKDKILQFRHRLLNKLLHPTLSALRDESHNGAPYGLLEAVKRLFHLRD